MTEDYDGNIDLAQDRELMSLLEETALSLEEGAASRTRSVFVAEGWTELKLTPNDFDHP